MIAPPGRLRCLPSLDLFVLITRRPLALFIPHFTYLTLRSATKEDTVSSIWAKDHFRRAI